MKRTSYLAVLSLLALSVTWSLSGCITRAVQQQLSPFQQIAVQAWTAFLLVALLRAGRGEWSLFRPDSRRAMLLLGLRGATGISGITLIVFALANAPIAQVVWLGALPYAAVWGILIHRDRLGGFEVLLLMIAVLGAAVMMDPLAALNGEVGRGELAAIGGNVLLSCSIIIGRSVVHLTSARYAHLWSTLLLAAGAAPLALVYDGLPSTTQLSVLPLAFLGGLMWAANGFLALYGFAHLRGGVASGIIAFEGVWALIFAYLFFSELPSTGGLVGGGVITLSALAMSRHALQHGS